MEMEIEIEKKQRQRPLGPCLCSFLELFFQPQP